MKLKKLIVSLTAVLGWASAAMANTYTVQFYNNDGAWYRDLLCNHFQDSSIANLFPYAETGTKIYRFINQNWSPATKQSNGLWTGSNGTILNGEAFIYVIPSTGTNFSITAYGTPLSTSTTSKTLVGGQWNAVGYGYPLAGRYIQSMEFTSNTVYYCSAYSTNSFGYFPSASSNDIVSCYNSDDTYSNYTNGVVTYTYNGATYVRPTWNTSYIWSPTRGLGQGFMIKPVNTVTWSMFSTGYTSPYAPVY